MKICLVSFNPFYPKPGMLNSYNEVIESYAWGFAALGHDIKYRINCIDPESRNIVFGLAIPCQLGLIDTFPPDTIFFNMERHKHFDASVLEKSWVYLVANKYQIWDYSPGNVAAINALNPKFPLCYTPLSYAPTLEKLPKDGEQDIDVLYYGMLKMPFRSEILREVGVVGPDFTGLSVMSLTNVWGTLRDEFIARSKVILNISVGEGDIFEIVRVSYLLANRKAVVCVSPDGHDEVEDDLQDVLKFVTAEQVHGVCKNLVDDAAAREEYASLCYETFRRRDIRQVITQFLT